MSDSRRQFIAGTSALIVRGLELPVGAQSTSANVVVIGGSWGCITAV